MLLTHRNSFFLYSGLVLFSVSLAVNAADDLVTPNPPTIAASSYLLQDFNSGRILAQKEPDTKVAPASLTKIVTAYVIYRELANKHLTLDDKVTVSRKAWQTGGSKMFLEVGKQVRVEDLLKGMIIQSGNDASVALAEHVGGNEATFASIMNQHAARLGMVNSHFENSTGLPTRNHYTTARDLSIVTYALIKEFPEYYRWDSQKEFTYNKITQPNRNKLLWRDKSVDGVKTGFTDEAGYCMVTSAKREEMRLIGVVMGTKNAEARADESQALINYGFQFYETHRLYQGNVTLKEVRVWGGETKTLQLGLAHDLYVTIPRRHYNDLKPIITMTSEITAPVEKGKSYGEINVSFAGRPLVKQPLVALKSIAAGNFFQRLYDKAIKMVQ